MSNPIYDTIEVEDFLALDPPILQLKANDDGTTCFWLTAEHAREVALAILATLATAERAAVLNAAFPDAIEEARR